VRSAGLLLIASVLCACGEASPAPDGVSDVPADATEESSDAELERFITTRVEGWGEARGERVPAEEQSRRREVVLSARARAEMDIRTGDPRIVIYGLTTVPDIDAETGFAYRYLG
jgi:hypothetical protein